MQEGKWIITGTEVGAFNIVYKCKKCSNKRDHVRECSVIPKISLDKFSFCGKMKSLGSVTGSPEFSKRGVDRSD